MANESVITRWAEALVSGEYTQARNTLRRVSVNKDDDDEGEVGLCCLGVLCELAVKDGIIPPGKEYSGFTGTGSVVMRYGPEDGHISDSFLPDAVSAWAGLGINNPIVDVTFTDDYGIPYNRQRSLSDLNDEDGYSFEQIADVIRGAFIAEPDASIKT